MNYIFRNKLTIILLSTFIFIGCGYKQTNTQIKEIGYLKFIKSPFSKYKILVNEKYEFNLDECIKKDDTGQCHDDTIDKLYETKAGNNIIKVYDRNNNLILQKEVYIGSSNTVEVNLK
ncbi:MAG: hypothetical protein ACNI28_02455 [Arcobacter sp.]|uniref:hypothetical protein n=1 Tax=Arcobacter sp. TaxID=1872629 RepID=UPI003B0035D8